MANSNTVLVTGATGFVGMQIVYQLLKRGYKVKATLRDINKKHILIKTLNNHGISSLGNLTFVTTELTKDDNWLQAMTGCDYVLSVASPVFFDKPKNEKEATRPAVEGILRILKFAKIAKVKRVVMTSNFGAIGFSQTNTNIITTEKHWTDTSIKGLSVYEKSKTLAEQAAWKYIEENNYPVEFATINPVAILGPALNQHVSGSFSILQHLLDGSLKAVPNIPLNIIDVRDVADLHIKAMTMPEANGHRFIASADSQITMPEIAEWIRKNMPAISSKVPRKQIPNWIIKMASLFNEKAKEGALLLNINRNISNSKAKRLLDWLPISSQEEAIEAALKSMIKYGVIQ